jgi:hypothetical protein
LQGEPLALPAHHVYTFDRLFGSAFRTGEGCDSCLRMKDMQMMTDENPVTAAWEENASVEAL